MDFDSDGLRIYFRDEFPQAADRGQPVLLIHGFASSGRTNWADTGWLRTLSDDGRRAVLFDHRGHGASDKPHEPAAYATSFMADDARRLLDHLEIERADIIGYSMGARVAAFLALSVPDRVRSVVFGGLGRHLVEGVGLPSGIADAMEAGSIDALTDPMQRMFRRFAEAGGNDLEALAACIRGSRQTLTAEEVGRIAVPCLVAVGTKDSVAGDARGLADLLPRGEVLDIPDRDHNPAVGDKVFKMGVLAFLAHRP
ncbi:MAG: alpha/beta fold hydrolase [Janthinobacterium lividum]